MSANQNLEARDQSNRLNPWVLADQLAEQAAVAIGQTMHYLDESVMQLNDIFFSIAREIKQESEMGGGLELFKHLEPQLNKTITVLQFHDLTTQLLKHATNRLQELRENLVFATEPKIAQTENHGVQPCPSNLDWSTDKLKHMEGGCVELF